VTEARGIVARNWWLFVVMGVVCMGIGIVTIVWPDKTLLTLGILLGIYLIVAAIMEIFDAITGAPQSRAFSLIVGVIALIAGLICIRRPGESLTAIVVVLGVYLVAEGVFTIVRAFVEEGPTRGLTVARGAIAAIVGIVILAWPDIGLATVAIVFAITIFFRGVLAVWLGLQLRKLQYEEQEVTKTATTTFV